MSFMTFNTKYYRDKIQYYDNNLIGNKEVHEAKQLLKILDDLVAEGYFDLNDELERKGIGATKLRSIIDKYGEKPFANTAVTELKAIFESEAYELKKYISLIFSHAVKDPELSSNPILHRLVKFSQWLGRDDNTAYIFLLRDTFLPYIFFNLNGTNNIYPWMIGRRFTEIVTNKKNLDDYFREPIYMALNQGYNNFDEFISYIIPIIKARLDNFPELTVVLRQLLQTIKEENIIIVESGYCGTFPLILMALDKRVDFKMFTTAPYLNDIYKDRIFTKECELIRDIEILYSHEMLFELTDFKNGDFIIRENTDENTRRKAYDGIRKIASMANQEHC